MNCQLCIFRTCTFVLVGKKKPGRVGKRWLLLKFLKILFKARDPNGTANILFSKKL